MNKLTKVILKIGSGRNLSTLTLHVPNDEQADLKKGRRARPFAIC